MKKYPMANAKCPLQNDEQVSAMIRQFAFFIFQWPLDIPFFL